ncbi:MAG: flavin reductase family protein [Kiritimatiellia bacterium]|jgi:flavin reductase (DIM6/NTAB) family NADH-FMN oxidoreductase RutF
MPTPIQPQNLTLNPFAVFDKRWMLLSAGDFSTGEWNCMTISWGFIGTMWGLPVVQPVVRPQRYTREFMDKFDTFTLCAFPEEFRPALQLLGSKSGRDGDKVAASGLHPVAAGTVAAPVFAEADLVIECRKLFRLPMTAESLLAEKAREMYPTQDYHIMYIGEVLSIRGE